MKKILAMMLTAAMMLSMSAAVMAEEETFTDMSEVTFNKTYNKHGDTAVSPAEVFEFENLKFEYVEDEGVGYTEEWAKANLPKISTVTYNEGAAGKTNLTEDEIKALEDEGKTYVIADYETQTFKITLPEAEYPSVGVYVYSFNEKDNNTEGVKYDTKKMYLKVTVIEDGTVKRIAAVHCEGELAEEGKVGEFDNDYYAGTLEITKEVTGNLGDKNKLFEVDVIFKAGSDDTVKSTIKYYNTTDAENVTEIPGSWTEKSVTISLKNGDTIKFENIPYGVTYTVQEKDYTTEANGAYEPAKYTVTQNETADLVNAAVEDDTTTEVDETKAACVSGVISDENNTVDNVDAVKITNTKGTNVDTGISVDSIPYIAMLGVVAIGGTGIIVSKKRRSED